MSTSTPSSYTLEWYQQAPEELGTYKICRRVSTDSEPLRPNDNLKAEGTCFTFEAI